MSIVLVQITLEILHLQPHLLRIKRYLRQYYCQLSLILTCSDMLTEEFDLITAVLAGSNTLELRLFAPEEILDVQEQVLTDRLCRSMDRFHDEWRR